MEPLSISQISEADFEQAQAILAKITCRLVEENDPSTRADYSLFIGNFFLACYVQGPTEQEDPKTRFIRHLCAEGMSPAPAAIRAEFCFSPEVKRALLELGHIPTGQEPPGITKRDPHTHIVAWKPFIDGVLALETV